MKLGSTKPGRFTFAGDAHGSFRQDFTLATRGDFAVEKDGMTLHLQQFAGNFAGDKVQLTRPLTLTRRRSDIALANLAQVHRCDPQLPLRLVGRPGRVGA